MDNFTRCRCPYEHPKPALIIYLPVYVNIPGEKTAKSLNLCSGSFSIGWSMFSRP